MPYFITEDAPDCEDWTVVKEDGEFVGCHDTKEGAVNQMVAASLNEEIPIGGEYEGEFIRSVRAPVPGADKFTTEEEALDRADELGCEGTHTMDEDGQTIYMPCSTHKIYDGLAGGGTSYSSTREELPSKPAPKKDQIEGSDKNKPGSAKGPGGDVKFSEATETALRNKVSEHNEEMKEKNKPDYTRTTYGQLATVYRRGSGAFSVSHRPGISRAAWSMARVNAYLYVLRNGRPKNPKYVGDFDLLPEKHPKSTRAAETPEFVEAIRQAYKDDKDKPRYSMRDVSLEPPAYMRAAARRGLEFLREGKGGSGLTDKTKREARAMAAGNVTADKWVRIRAWISRHIKDLEAPDADPSSDNYPSAGVVAHLLWGSGPSMRAAERALKYADGVVKRLEEENKGRARGKAVSSLEIRVNSADWELRETATGMTFEGYAAVFNSPSLPLSGSPRGGTFIERIAPGSFIRSLKARNDIKLLWNHDTSEVLGSTRSGTLKLVEDERGLKVTASLPNTSAGRDAAELLRRGDVDAMSFGFTVPRDGDDWNSEGNERTLREVMLHEVSIVAFPAYAETAGMASVRGLEKVALRAQVDLDDLSDALLKLENGEVMTEDETKLLMEVLDSISPEDSDPPETDLPEDEEEEDEPKGPEGDLGMLELKKKKLELLLKGI